MFVENLKTMNSIRIEEFEVPADIMAEVANIVTSNDLENRITGVDEDETVIFLEVRYDKEEEDQREAIHEIHDAIADYDEDDNDNDDQEEEED
jgi:hypothetical protein